jgi:hypothetical protein
MPNTFTLIASSTVGSGGAANITFSAIPSTYTDLCLVLSLRGAASADWADNLIKFNSTTANYTNKYVYGNGASALPGSNAYAGSGGYIGGAPASTNTANTFNNTIVYIPNYAGSTNKSYSVDAVAEANATTAYQHILAGLWSDTSVISSIVLVTDNGANYAQYSSAYLYGIIKS